MREQQIMQVFMRVSAVRRTLSISETISRLRLYFGKIFETAIFIFKFYEKTFGNVRNREMLYSMLFFALGNVVDFE